VQVQQDQDEQAGGDADGLDEELQGDLDAVLPPVQLGDEPVLAQPLAPVHEQLDVHAGETRQHVLDDGIQRQGCQCGGQQRPGNQCNDVRAHA